MRRYLDMIDEEDNRLSNIWNDIVEKSVNKEPIENPEAEIKLVSTLGIGSDFHTILHIPAVSKLMAMIQYSIALMSREQVIDLLAYSYGTSEDGAELLMNKIKEYTETLEIKARVITEGNPS